MKNDNLNNPNSNDTHNLLNLECDNILNNIKTASHKPQAEADDHTTNSAFSGPRINDINHSNDTSNICEDSNITENGDFDEKEKEGKKASITINQINVIRPNITNNTINHTINNIGNIQRNSTQNMHFPTNMTEFNNDLDTINNMNNMNNLSRLNNLGGISSLESLNRDKGINNLNNLNNLNGFNMFNHKVEAPNFAYNTPFKFNVPKNPNQDNNKTIHGSNHSNLSYLNNLNHLGHLNNLNNMNLNSNNISHISLNGSSNQNNLSNHSNLSKICNIGNLNLNRSNNLNNLKLNGSNRNNLNNIGNLSNPAVYQQTPSYKNKNISSYKFEYFKREDINKNILRRFKKFVRKFFTNHSNIKFISSKFGILRHFIKLNLLPPMSFTHEDNVIEFKSFNSSYIFWLFSNPGIKEIFSIFIENKMDEFLKEMENKLMVKAKDKKQIESDLEKIKRYLVDFCELYNIKSNTSCLYQKLVDNYNKKKNKKLYRENEENNKKVVGSHFEESTYSSDTQDKKVNNLQQINEKMENIFDENSKKSMERHYNYFKDFNIK